MRTALENQVAIKINHRPLKFYCEACTSAIIVKYLQKGEKACCPFCGKLNVVPLDAVETDEKPDYTSFKSQLARDNQEQESSRKLLSTKRATGSAFIAWLVTTIMHSLTGDENKALGFVMTFAVAYCIEYFWPSRTKKRKLTREIARATHFCYVCARHISRGELCYSEFEWRSFLAKTRRYYCLKCYEEIFMTPEPPIDKLKRPKRKFGWLTGNNDY